MENKTLSLYDNPKNDSVGMKIALKILSAYPLFWTVAVLVAGYFQHKPLLYLIMFTWILVTFVGSLLWVIFMTYLLIEKKISGKEALTHFLVAVTGIVAAYLVTLYDVLNNGVKYID